LSITYVDMTDPANIERAVQPGKTKMLWVETPTNPMLKLVDLARAAELAKKHQLISVCDNTFMTPYFQRPLEFGFDVVTHSTTKYLNGHSDVIGGFVATSRKDLADRIYFLQNAVGGVPGPMDAFLVLRGVKTLHVRMQRHEENAHRIADFLATHPKVNKVTWPGLTSHPQHALARKQMKGFGGMMTFDMKGGLENARRFLKTVKVFACAESLGGVESLIEHPAIMTHASIPKENREKLGITDGLIRLSVGIEDVNDLIDDLKAGFDAA
ncbi:MAG TPA: PLP-dependent transferase, partial [Archangium sp.]